MSKAPSQIFLEAIQQGEKDKVDRYLQSKEVNPDFPIDITSQQTGLHIAATHNHIDIAKSLVSAGARMDIKDKYDFTPLSLALIHKNHQLAEFFINQNAPVNGYQTSKQSTPLHLAAQKNLPNLVLALLTKGADKNAQDKNGNTPLHRILRGPTGIKIAKTLLDSGAKVNVPNNAGLLPMDIAYEKRNKPLAICLQNHGSCSYHHHSDKIERWLEAEPIKIHTTNVLNKRQRDEAADDNSKDNSTDNVTDLIKRFRHGASLETNEAGTAIKNDETESSNDQDMKPKN